VATISVTFLRFNLPNFVQYHRSPSPDIIWGNGVPPRHYTTAAAAAAATVTATTTTTTN